MSEPNTGHRYQGNEFCLVCFKTKANHPPDPIVKEHVEHAFNGYGNICQTCLKHKDDTIHKSEVQPTILDNKGATVNFCGGHECPLCRKQSKHDYHCAAPREIVCEACKEQAVADLRRIPTIQSLDRPILEGREIVELTLQYDAQVALMSLEQIEAHILDCRKKIEMLKLAAIAGSRGRALKLKESMAKYTPEELAEFRANARNAGKSKKHAMSKDEKLIQQAMKMGLSREAAEKLVGGK